MIHPTKAEVESFKNELALRLKKNFDYPRKAVFRHIEGTVQVRILVEDQDGELVVFTEVVGTSKDVLAKAALASVNRCFPIENSYNIVSYTDTISIEYRLEEVVNEKAVSSSK